MGECTYASASILKRSDFRVTSNYVGLPKTLVTDNDTNFSSAEFGEFLINNYIYHVFIRPRHHASNGAAESEVQDLKCSSGGNLVNLEKAVVLHFV